MSSEQQSEQSDWEPPVTLPLRLEEADELCDLLGSRPHSEEWSGRLFEILGTLIERARPAA
ncbi:MAG: hypothetical protein ACTHMY_01615 [Solirubrobacteraceae bacterium]